jgi:hypothetical protein
MRHWLGAVAAAGLLAAAVVPLGTPAAAETSSARMLTLGEAGNADKPVILRGSAAAPRPAAVVLRSRDPEDPQLHQRADHGRRRAAGPVLLGLPRRL